MVFSSLPFLYALFPVVLVAYFLIPNRVWRNSVLLVSSVFFYAWGEPKFVLLMMAATLVAWVGGLFIHRFDRRGAGRAKRAALILTVCLLVANLVIFKYLNFVVDNLNLLFSGRLSIPAIALPIGISFYTFQILSYVIDLYRGEVAVQRNFFWLALYVCFFPQLIAGPIVRYQTIEHEIRHRRETLDDVVAGFKRFIIGLAKKALLANGAAVVAELVYNNPRDAYGTAVYWIAALAYTMQIYFDFSGYSDMAIGLGRIFGFHFLENFNYPYISRSITEFWRRWHISLSTWFRDYIYIPLGGNRVRKSRWILNILIVWGLTGLWHGASWNFLLWGFYYAALLLLEKLLLHRLLDKLPGLIRWAYAFFFVVVGWVIFDLTDFSQMAGALGMMFTYHPTDWFGAVAANADLLWAVVWIPLGLVCMLPILPRLKLPDNLWGRSLSHALHLALAGLCVVVILSSSYNPFIYFRF